MIRKPLYNNGITRPQQKYSLSSVVMRGWEALPRYEKKRREVLEDDEILFWSECCIFASANSMTTIPEA